MKNVVGVLVFLFTVTVTPGYGIVCYSDTCRATLTSTCSPFSGFKTDKVHCNHSCVLTTETTKYSQVVTRGCGGLSDLGCYDRTTTDGNGEELATKQCFCDQDFCNAEVRPPSWSTTVGLFVGIMAANLMIMMFTVKEYNDTHDEKW